jgi:hypothetical protein
VIDAASTNISSLTGLLIRSEIRYLLREIQNSKFKTQYAYVQRTMIPA